MMGFSATALAQTVPDTAQVPTTGLDLPSVLTTFGKVDPHFRKATAIVNGTVITGTDVDQRLALVMLANGNANIGPEERDRLRLQVLRNLIDETLQIQEAKSQDITVSRDEIDASYARVAARFKQTPDQLAQFLRDNHSSARSIKRQIEGELAWNRLLRRRVEPFVNVSEEDIQAIMDRLQASKGTKEYHVAEIYLSATPANQNEVLANVRKIVEQLKAGGSFPAYARQFSEASTSPVGGDLGWVRAEQLPDPLAQAVNSLAVGQLAGPVPVPGGFSIIYLVDSRQIGTADPRDAVLNLRQMSLKFAPGTSEAAMTAQASAFAKATQTMGGCGGAAAVAKTFNAEVVDNDQIRIRDLPGPLQQMMLGMSVGQATPPFGSQAEGIRVLVMCGRDEAQASMPTADALRAAEEEKRVNARAQRYLRDLRRDAVVEYR